MEILVKKLLVIMMMAILTSCSMSNSVNMFNGKDLAGWENPYDWGKVELVGDEIHLSTVKKKFFLCTTKKYKDFIFEGEVKLPAGKSNSGFLFRCLQKKGKAWGYQAECDPSDRSWSGGLYDEGRRRWMHPDRDHKVGKDEHFQKNLSPGWGEDRLGALKRHDWNKYVIECRGPEIKITVNGVLTTHIIDTIDSEGFIGIQHHGEKGQIYKFRNIKITEL